MIPSGVNVGMSGFTGAGYPKDVPHALARRIMDENIAGHEFRRRIRRRAPVRSTLPS